MKNGKLLKKVFAFASSFIIGGIALAGATIDVKAALTDEEVSRNTGDSLLIDEQIAYYEQGSDFRFDSADVVGSIPTGEYTLSPITLNVGDVFALSNANIDALISQDVVDLNGTIYNTYFGDNVTIDSNYVSKTLHYAFYDAATLSNVVHEGYWTEEEANAFYATGNNGSWNYNGVEVIPVEEAEGVAFYNIRADRVGSTVVTISDYKIGDTTIKLDIPITIVGGTTTPSEPTTGDTSDTDSNNGNTDFVDSNSVTGKSRFIALLYENVLERYATESEIADWVQELENGKNGAEVAQGFIFSQEFLNKNLSDEDYVECLYMSMMGRSSDEGGKNDWVTRLDNGVSRLYVFKQFVNSQEFANMCEEYAIVQGDVALGEARDENYDVTRFVARNYREFLGRDYDEAGLNDWTSRINNREQTMQDIASGFVFSQECINMNLSNEAYVQMLYRGCFDRTGDEAGVEDWVSKLNAGTQNREEVFLGFANSQEFANMVSSYGL